jgi:hypothetical protein
MREQQLIVLAILMGVASIAFAFLGAFGVILSGLFVIFVCTSGELREHSPTSAVGRSPEQRAAIAEERVCSVAPLKFYRWCGIVILVIGIAGFVWEQGQS